jgi:hypothetical protein
MAYELQRLRLFRAEVSNLRFIQVEGGEETVQSKRLLHGECQ